MSRPELTDVEQAILAKAGDLEITKKRIRQVWVSAAVFAAALVFFGVAFQDWRIVTAVAVIYVVINTMERAAYGKTVLAYKSLVQKLVPDSKEQVGTEDHGR